jgi:5-methylcytosine-specific restriction endonuclease McrA
MTSLFDALSGAFKQCSEAFARGNQRDPVAVAMPYADYLRTEHWQSTRLRALQRAGFQCKDCEISGVQLDVHHLTYDRLGREAESDLIVLCHRCHERAHANDDRSAA